MIAKSNGDGTATVNGIPYQIFDGEKPYKEMGEVNVIMVWQAWDGFTRWYESGTWFDCRFPHQDYESRGIDTRQICRISIDDEEIVGPDWYKDLLV